MGYARAGMNRTPKRLLFALVPVLLAVSLVTAGYYAGRGEAARTYQREFELLALSWTLGDVVGDDKRDGIIEAFFDAEEARLGMDSFAWDPPSMPVPFVGAAPIVGQHANAAINSMHFRLDHEIALPKPPDVVRILMTGGSTAFGAGAPSQDRTVGAYLERMLTPADGSYRVEVLPLAVPAWATTHERILIENLFVDLEPDVVLSFSGNNDVHWGQRGRNVMWFRTYSEGYFLDLFRRAWRQAGGQPLPPPAPAFAQPVAPLLVADRLRRNVSLATHALLMDEVPYVFALQPTLATTGKRLSPRESRALEERAAKVDGHIEYFRECYARIDETLREATREGLRYVDLRGAFDEFGADTEVFIDSYHFGDRGNEKIAQALAFGLEGLVERQLKP